MLCALLLPVMAFAQNITVKGQVTDANGEPISGAYVSEQNSTAGTVTDLDGNYSISVAPNATLEFSFMGYVTSVAPVGGKSVVNATLIEDAEALEATVVIGYGTARRQDVTGSIASVGGESLRAVPANDVTHALEGRIAGVEMTQTSSRPGSSMQIRIRGQRSLSASNDPLIVLDGIPFMGNLSDISTNDIKSMDILKDAASTAIYGSRGANGVIMITTYKGVEGQDARVSFNSYITAKKAVKYPMMPADKYIKMRDMAGIYKNTLDESNDQFTDWQDMFYRPGYTQNYELSVAGGTQNGSYRFGTTYYKDQAVLPTQAYDRISLNGSVDQKIGKWFRIGFSTNINYNTNQGNQVDMYGILSKSPLVVPFAEDGSLKYRINMPSDNDQYVFDRARLEELTDLGVYNSESNSFGTYNTGYVQFSFPWIEGLSYKASLGLNYRNTRGGSFTGVGVNGSATSNNSASWSFSENMNWTVENLLTYDRTFGGVPLDLGSGELAFNSTPVRSSVRNTVPEVYTKCIFPDLKDGVANLPANPRVTGALTKTAARMVLSKAYLTYAWWLENPKNIPTYPECPRTDPDGHDAKWYFQAAYDLAIEAIQDPGPFGLMDYFWQTNAGEYDRNKESVFYADHTENSEQYNGASLSYGSGGGQDNFAGWMMTWNYPNMQATNNEGNKINPVLRTDSQFLGRPWTRMAPTQEALAKFTDPDMDSRADGTFTLTFKTNWADGGNNSQWVEGPNGHHIGLGETFLAYIFNDDPTVEYSFNSSNGILGVSPNYDYYVITPSRLSRNNYPGMWKLGPYRTNTAGTGQPNAASTRPFVILKFSELYFTAAEAAVKGATTKPGFSASECINVLRARAGKWNYKVNEGVEYIADFSKELTDKTPQTITIDYILDESMRENFAAGFRWYELVRTQT